MLIVCITWNSRQTIEEGLKEVAWRRNYFDVKILKKVKKRSHPQLCDEPVMLPECVG